MSFHPMLAESSPAQTIAEVYELRATFYVGLASYTVLLYDHLLTFGEEVKYIWRKRKRRPLIWLFLLNRYLAPLAFIGNLYAYLSNSFEYDRCKHFVRYEGAMTVIGINIASLMMLLRVCAIYNNRKSVVALVTFVLSLELGTNAWLLTNGIAVRHTIHIKACTMIFDTNKIHGFAASASAWTPLVFDTLVLALTIYQTYNGILNPTLRGTTWILLKEGVLYYMVIFSSTLVLTLMIVFAPPGIQNICAQMEYLLTVVMISRITLHLKRAAHKNDHFGWIRDLSFISSDGSQSPVTFAQNRQVSNAPFNISIRSQTIMHDNRKELSDWPQRKTSLVCRPGMAHTRKTRHDELDEEWYEIASMSPQRACRERVGRTEDDARVFL